MMSMMDLHAINAGPFLVNYFTFCERQHTPIRQLMGWKGDGPFVEYFNFYLPLQLIKRASLGGGPFRETLDWCFWVRPFCQLKVDAFYLWNATKRYVTVEDFITNEATKQLGLVDQDNDNKDKTGLTMTTDVFYHIRALFMKSWV